MALKKDEETVGSHDIISLLSSPGRDFLVRNNGHQVKIESLIAKAVGLYFSGSWCGPCRRFTPNLVEVYNELSSNADFEVVFVSSDRDEESFSAYFKKMPWLALPFADLETRKSLKELFKVRGIPHLVILDKTGKVSTGEGVRIIYDYGADGYPFTPQRINDLKEEEERAKREQSLRSILTHGSRDYLISNDGKEIPVSELEGKTVGLYFSVNSHRGCLHFTDRLFEVYKKLREKGEAFELVLVSLDDEEQEFKNCYEQMTWLALPFKDKACDKLVRYFELRTLPTLVVIGPDGKTLHSNVVESIEEHGDEAYPFTPEKFAKLAEMEKAKLEAQTLESILISADKDFVISKDGSKVPVPELVGKNILLYFSAHWCPPCRDFLPRFIAVYEEIKAKDDAFEVIFISSDHDQSSFDDFFSGMPWLALPFGDERKALLQRRFKIKGIPAVVAIGPNGRTASTQARQLIQVHGADAYPFTDERVKQLEEQLEEMAKGWPEKLKHKLHIEHELSLTRRTAYVCDGCQEKGRAWSYLCNQCDFDLHPKCALKKEESKADQDSHPDGEPGKAKEGYVCDGDECRKA